jgi:hypothetical protein
MQATLTPQETAPQETDPHDAFEIAPGVVLAGRTEKPSPSLASDATSSPIGAALSAPWTPHVATASDVAAAAPTSSAEPNFRVTAADHVEAPSASKWASSIFMGLFAICGAAAAAAWPHYSDAAKQTIAHWIPPFALISSQPAPTAAASPASPTAAASPQPAAADQASAQPAAPAQPAPAAASAIAAAAPPSAPTPPSTARDLAAMGQQIEQLKASVEQLKASQEKMADQMAAQIAQQVARDVARKPQARRPERAKLSALPPRPIRKPRPEFSAAQTAAILAVPRTAAPLPPPQAAPMPVSPAPYNSRAPVINRTDGDPVDRPPLPVR